MGSPVSQVASSTQPQGKGRSSNAPFAISGVNGGEVPAFAPSNGLTSQPQGKGFASGQTDIRTALDGVQDQMEQPSTPPMNQPRSGKGSSVTYPGQGGQPKMGQPNMYPNTVGQWDNASIQPARMKSGKGKGA